MSRATLLASTVAGVTLLGFASLMGAELPSSSALTGKVTSQAEGAMEGVIIGAKKAGSTITTWVVSNAQGQYTFPRDRMEPGKHTLSIRAVGYELPKTSVDVTDQSAHLDLQLDKVTSQSKLVMQMSNGELLASVPGTPEQKRMLAGCLNCHTLQRVLFSHFDADEMTRVVQRMSMHTNNSSPIHPWMRPVNYPAPIPASPIGKYLSSINLSASDTFQFPLKTLPRPKGKATQVIYTTYDLPRPDASPHDEVFDAQGNVWYSDFNSQFMGKLDPKTGKVVEYAIPQARFGQIAQGGLQVDIDREGRIYYGNMSQLQIIRFDPKTEKISEWKVPTPWSAPYDAEAGRNGEAWTGSMLTDRVARLDIKTGQYTEYQLPHPTHIRRVHIDDSKSLGTLWIGNNHGASIVKVEPLD